MMQTRLPLLYTHHYHAPHQPNPYTAPQDHKRGLVDVGMRPVAGFVGAFCGAQDLD